MNCSLERIAFLTLIALFVVSNRPSPADAQPPAALVQVAPVVEKKLSVGRTFTGSVVPPRTSVVGSAVDGRVVEANFNEGDLVGMVADEKSQALVGQPLVKLRTETFVIEIEIAIAEHDLSFQELQQLEKSLPQQIAQQSAMLLVADAKMEYTRLRYDRVKNLEADKVASTEDLEEAKSVWLAAEQSRQAERAKLEELEKTREARLNQASLRVRGAKEKVNRLKDILKKYTIRAPFVGFVVEKHTEVGAWVSQGDPVAEIIQLDPVEVDVFVPEHSVGNIKVGKSVSISIGALPDRVLVGRVARIVPQADLRSRSFRVKIRLDNPEYEIKAGMLASATIPVGDETPVLLVPKDALVLNGRQRSVVVADTEPRSGRAVARMTPVEIGIADGSFIQIAGDLKAGDQVVVRGNERLRPGQPLRTITAAKPASQAN